MQPANGEPDPGEATTGVRASLSAIVWPVYAGVSNGHPGAVQGACPNGEPWGQPGYERGQITWQRQANGEIEGRALIVVPAGVWTHWVFCSGFQQAALMDCTQMDFPLALASTTVVDLNPIKGPQSTEEATSTPGRSNGHSVIVGGGLYVDLDRTTQDGAS